AMPIHTAEFPSNWELSSARAVKVVHFLSETVGVNPRRLAAVGYSQFHPRSHKFIGRNRRIEILLTPAIVEKEGGLAVAEKETGIKAPRLVRTEPPAKKVVAARSTGKRAAAAKSKKKKR